MEPRENSIAARELISKYECYCYQVAFYLLSNEQDALSASVAALTELSLDTGFADMPEAAQRQRVKRAACLHALQVRKNTVMAG